MESMPRTQVSACSTMQRSLASAAPDRLLPCKVRPWQEICLGDIAWQTHSTVCSWPGCQ